jgi:adenosine deaminase
MIRDKIYKLLKIFLHDHLDGGLRVSTIIKIAKANNIQLPYQDEESLKNWFYEEFSSKDFDKCFKAFDLSGAVMQTVNVRAHKNFRLGSNYFANETELNCE